MLASSLLSLVPSLILLLVNAHVPVVIQLIFPEIHKDVDGMAVE